MDINQKKMRPISSDLDLKSLVNKEFIIWLSGNFFSWDTAGRGSSCLFMELVFRGPPSAVGICKPPSLKSCNGPAYQFSCLLLLHENLLNLPSEHTKITVYNSHLSAFPWPNVVF